MLAEHLPFAEAGLAPVERAALVEMIGGMMLLHPEGKLSDAEQKVKVKLYLSTLADLPHDLCALAFSRAAKTIAFFPKPAELRRLVGKELTERQAHLASIRQLRLKHQLEYRPPSTEPVHEPSAAERDQFNRDMRAAELAIRMFPNGDCRSLEKGEADPAPLDTDEEPALPL